jgi:hypothetical protein
MNDDLKGEMNFKNSLMFFGIPGLLIFLEVYCLPPFLVNQGIPLISDYFLVIWGPIIILFIIILRRWLHSRKAGKKKTFNEYFNLRTLRGKAWLWVIAGLLTAIK